LPRYNLGIPSTLKAYFDHIARAGITFKDWKSLEAYMVNWLDTVANKRLHGTTLA
jgi:FMN-dependent NADH-azoreductase